MTSRYADRPCPLFDPTLFPLVDPIDASRLSPIRPPSWPTRPVPLIYRHPSPSRSSCHMPIATNISLVPIDTPFGSTGIIGYVGRNKQVYGCFLKKYPSQRDLSTYVDSIVCLTLDGQIIGKLPNSQPILFINSIGSICGEYMLSATDATTCTSIAKSMPRNRFYTVSKS
jgi:hypothetical protein